MYGTSFLDITIEKLLEIKKKVEELRPEVEVFLCTYDVFAKIKKIVADYEAISYTEYIKEPWYQSSIPIEAFYTRQLCWEAAADLVKQGKRVCIIEENKDGKLCYWKSFPGKDRDNCSRSQL